MKALRFELGCAPVGMIIRAWDVRFSPPAPASMAPVPELGDVLRLPAAPHFTVCPDNAEI